MKLFKRALSISSDQQRATSFQDVWGKNLEHFGTATASGSNVNLDTAMQVSAVFACVRIISDNVSTLPLDLYRRNGDLRERFTNVPEWAQFTSADRVGKIDLLSQVTVSILTEGNAFVATYRDSNQKIIGLDVLDPEAVEIKLVGGARMFRLNGGEMLTDREILHIPGMLQPGSMRGMSPIKYARQSIGLSMAATEFGATFFGNGGLPAMTVEVPGELSDVGVSALKRAWNDAHGGTANAHKLAVLTEGAKFTKVSLDPDDAQFLQTREFQVSDITRIFGVPPHLVGDATNSTSWGSGLAAQNTTFIQHTLRPLVERIEAGLNHLLLSEGLPPTVFVKLSMDGLLRGDTQQRLEGYATGLASGFYTVNEVRAWEELPPLPDTAPQEAPNE